MNIPEKIRISGIDYAVELTDGPVVVDGRQCYGSIEYEGHRILLDKNLGDHAQMCCTLLHEVFHGIVRDRMIDFGESVDEEIVVEAFARGLYQVLADNPDLMKRGK